MRPVLACAAIDTLHETAQVSTSLGEVETEFGEGSSAPDDLGEDGPLDGGCDEIASLAYEFQFFIETDSNPRSKDETADSLALDPLLRPPAAA